MSNGADERFEILNMEKLSIRNKMVAHVQQFHHTQIKPHRKRKERELLKVVRNDKCQFLLCHSRTHKI